jgi:hypothetical protein
MRGAARSVKARIEAYSQRAAEAAHVPTTKVGWAGFVGSGLRDNSTRFL